MRRCLPLIFFLAATAAADNLTVDRRSIQVNDTVTIIVSLEGDSASMDNVNVPVRNLIIGGPPSISSEFSWINGEMIRRKVFRFRARPINAGIATAGPVVVFSGRRRDTLPTVTIQVLPDRASMTTDPLQILRELAATGREPFFIVAEANKSRAYVGEEVVVTWTLYNAVTVQQWQIANVPKLDSFWSEELDVRGEQPAQIVLGGAVTQVLPIRRVALFPLRPGQLSIDSMEVEAAVLRRTDSGPFGMYEGSLVEAAFRSAPITIEARPLPPGPRVDAVGDLTLRCSPPVQAGAGPVVVNATLSGRGNLRAATPPRPAGRLAANIQVEPLSTNVQRTGEVFDMTRRWRLMLFPRAAGELRIPPLVTTVFDPSAGERRELRCAASTLLATMPHAAPARPELAAAKAPVRQRLLRRAARVGAPIALVAACALLFVPRWRRHRALEEDVKEIVGAGEPAAIRSAIRHRLQSDGVDADLFMQEQSERGDAWRSLMSLLEGLEHDRIVLGDVQDEIRRRAREVLVESRNAVASHARDRASHPPAV